VIGEAILDGTYNLVNQEVITRIDGKARTEFLIVALNSTTKQRVKT